MYDLLSIRKMDKVANARIRKLSGVTKRVNERIHESVIRWFGHMEIMVNDRIAKTIDVEKCAGSC